jgi:hypothetical protein
MVEGEKMFMGKEPEATAPQPESESKNELAGQFGVNILNTLGLAAVIPPRVVDNKLVMTGGINEKFNMFEQKEIIIGELPGIDGIIGAESHGDRPPFKITAETDGRAGITQVELNLVRDMGKEFYPRTF